MEGDSYDLNLPFAPPYSPARPFSRFFRKPASALRGKGVLFDEYAAPTEVRPAIDAGASQSIRDREDETKDGKKDR